MDTNLAKSLRSLVPGKIFSVACIFYLVLALSFSVEAASSADSTNEAVESAVRIAGSPSLDWNLNQIGQPLVTLPAQISTVSDLKFAYPVGQMRFPLFQTLRFNERSNEYIVKVENTRGENSREVFLKPSADSEKYVAREAGLELTDNRGVKTVRANGTEYTFVRFIDGVDRCIRMKTSDGSIVTLVYGKDNLVRGLVDSRGRALRFSYEAGQVNAVTQTWTTNGAAFSKTWTVGPNHPPANREQVKLAHAASSGPIAARFTKPIPNNAMTPQYTARMAVSDHQLAAIFGGAGAVAAANSYEPAALGSQYPIYRGDLLAGDGHMIRGHLSYAMHLYGNAEGTADSALYVPTGFTSHSAEPGPTDAAVTFYYPRLGNMTDVTLAVFHVAHFSLNGTGGVQVGSIEGGRVRIGDIGGPGGSVLGYRHSHIEFYRGNTGLPSAAAREHLRIDPAAVFATR